MCVRRSVSNPCAARVCRHTTKRTYLHEHEHELYLSVCPPVCVCLYRCLISAHGCGVVRCGAFWPVVNSMHMNEWIVWSTNQREEGDRSHGCIYIYGCVYVCMCVCLPHGCLVSTDLSLYIPTRHTHLRTYMLSVGRGAVLRVHVCPGESV